MKRGMASYQETPDDEPTEKRLPSAVLALEQPDPSIDVDFEETPLWKATLQPGGEAVSGIVRAPQRRIGPWIAVVAVIGFALLAIGILLNTQALP